MVEKGPQSHSLLPKLCTEWPLSAGHCPWRWEYACPSPATASSCGVTEFVETLPRGQPPAILKLASPDPGQFTPGSLSQGPQQALTWSLRAGVPPLRKHPAGPPPSRDTPWLQPRSAGSHSPLRLPGPSAVPLRETSGILFPGLQGLWVGSCPWGSDSHRSGHPPAGTPRASPRGRPRVRAR